MAINIGGRLHSVATGNVVAGANEIFDDTEQKKQSDINAELREDIAGIHVPTDVSELVNGANYVNEDQLAAKQDEITAGVESNVDDDGGNPSASVEFEDGHLSFNFKNLKLKFSDLTAADKEAIRGPQGATGLYEANGSLLTQLETTLGQSQQYAMTQKAVTDELMTEVGRLQEDVDKRANRYINASNEWAAGSSSANCSFVRVTPGTEIKVVANNSHEAQIAFLTDCATSGTVLWADGWSARKSIARGTSSIEKVPNDAVWIYYTRTSGGDSFAPSIYLLNRVSELGSIKYSEMALPSRGYQEINFYIGSNNKWSSSNTAKTILIPVEAGEQYLITPKGSYQITYAYLTDKDGIANNAEPHWVTGYTSRMNSLSKPARTLLTIPEGAKYLSYLSMNSAELRDMDFAKLVVVNESAKAYINSISTNKTLNIRLENQRINDTTTSVDPKYGGYGGYTSTPGIKRYSTPGKLRNPIDGKVYFSFSHATVNSQFTVYGYNAEGKIIGHEVFTYENDGVPYLVNLDVTWSFFKLNLALAVNDGDPVPDIVYMTVKGNFADNYQSSVVPQFAKNAGDNWCVPITVQVDIPVPTTQETETSVVTDTVNIGYDNGVLALPSTYSAHGDPTRLIIFCHGSGHHYAQGTTSFPTGNNGIDPTYWLSEGYAVLDMDGLPQPTGGTDATAHWCVPVAYQCYLKAYRHVINNYNIRKDGVFLGGRSLGGAMALTIMAFEQIPVIACCPFVPQGPTPMLSFKSKSREEKEMLATYCGIYNPNNVVWPAANGSFSQDLLDVLTMEYATVNGQERYVGNFGRLMQYAPSYRLAVNNPSMEALTDARMFASGAKDYILEISGNVAIKTRIPTKFFGAWDDSDVAPWNINLWVRMFRNGGCVVEQRMFATGGHGFELNAANKVATFVNSMGKTLTNVPIAYIEALQFWRNYE